MGQEVTNLTLDIRWDASTNPSDPRLTEYLAYGVVTDAVLACEGNQRCRACDVGGDDYSAVRIAEPVLQASWGWSMRLTRSAGVLEGEAAVQEVWGVTSVIRVPSQHLHTESGSDPGAHQGRSPWTTDP